MKNWISEQYLSSKNKNQLITISMVHFQVDTNVVNIHLHSNMLQLENYGIPAITHIDWDDNKDEHTSDGDI